MRTPIALVSSLVLACVCSTGLATRGEADEACKRIMAGQIKVCAEDCQRKALAATSIKDPDNNVLFLCIKRCAQDMTMQGQLCD